MRRSVAVSILLVVCFASGLATAADTAKSGTFSGTMSYSCPMTVMLMGKDGRFNFDCLGVYVTDPADSPFNNSSIRIVGSGLFLKGKYTEVGSMCQTLATGDQIFSTYEGQTVGPRQVKGTFAYTGGTGSFSGIAGEGEFERLNVAKPAMEGTTQGYAKQKATWRIEEIK